MEDKLKKVIEREKKRNLTQRLQIEYLLKIIQNIGRGRNIKALETGCGYGFFSRKVSQYCSPLYATDLFDCFPREFKKNNSIKYISGVDANKLPFKNDFFDVVYSMDVIEHIEDDIGFIKESFRVLKPGGRLIVGTPNINRLSRVILRSMGKKAEFPLSLGKDPYYGEIIHYREYTVKDFMDKLDKSGYRYKMTNIYYLSLGILGYIEVKCLKLLKNYSQFFIFVIEKK